MVRNEHQAAVDRKGIERSFMDCAPVCFVNLDSLNVTPYFTHYKRLLATPYDLIYWDRIGRDEDTGALNTYRYTRKVSTASTASNLKDLALGYTGFRRFAAKILSQRDYRIVIALTGNAAVLLGGVLKRKYAGRYIMDIRDYFLENIPPYRLAEQPVIDSAALALISSPAFTAFLGDHDFQVIHNTQALDETDIERITQRQRPGKPFVIANIGTAKALDVDRMTIDCFANDERFELRFIGRGFEALESHCRAKGVRNVKIAGAFPSSQTTDLYKDVDAILATYGSTRAHVRYALPNKLYFAAQLGLPLLASPGTYLAQVVKDNHLGMELDIEDPSAKNRVLALYTAEAAKRRSESAASFMQAVEKDNENAFGKIARILNSASR